MLNSKPIRSMSHMLIGLGDILSRIFPYMDFSLKQSGISEEYKITAREYLTASFIISVIVFVVITLSVYIPLATAKKGNPDLGPIIGIIVSVLTLAYYLAQPRRIINRRIKYIERNLLYMLRSILVQIRSGVPIFNTIVSIAVGEYGPISKEFKTVVEKVNAGQSVVDSLEELALRNPSIYFRRALWQLVNSLKSGSDVGNNLADVIRSLSKEQLIEIGRYKSILNPLAMMYMMIAVILPSLSITMLIVLSSFPGMESVGNEQTFWSLFGINIVLQFIFLGIIKSKRPNLIGA